MERQYIVETKSSAPTIAMEAELAHSLLALEVVCRLKKIEIKKTPIAMESHSEVFKKINHIPEFCLLSYI